MSNLTAKLEHQADDRSNGPHDPHEINPKIASDIHYWTKELGVTGQVLHEAIRVHGTKVEKIRAALRHGDVSLNQTQTP